MARAATKAEQQAFIHKMWVSIAGLDLQGLFPSVLIAQAAKESGWGLSALAQPPNNNVFSVTKGSGWTGRTVEMRDNHNGKMYTFRVYSSLQESINDRNRLLLSASRYAKARTAATPEEQARALQAAGYAESATYADSLINNYIVPYNLKRYDSLKKKIMNNKTLSSIMLAAGVIIAVIGLYNIANLSKYLK